MFLSLLAVTLAVALVLSLAVARGFRGPVSRILQRLVGEDLAPAWTRYVLFAVVIVGVSGGVRVYQLERYVTPRELEAVPIVLNGDRWVLEVYGTVIGSLQGIAWTLLIFYLVSLIAYVLVRGFELRRDRSPDR